MSDQGLGEYLRRLNAQVEHDARREGGKPYKVRAFTALVMKDLEEAGEISGGEECYHHGGSTRGSWEIHGYAAQDDEEDLRLDLFVSHFQDTDELQTVLRSELDKRVKYGLRFYRKAREGYGEQIEPAHQDVAEMYDRVRQMSQARARVRLLILTNHLAGLKELSNPEADDLDVQIEIWDIERIHRLTLSETPRQPIDIDLQKTTGGTIPCLPMPRPAQDYTCYLAMIPGEVISLLYERYGARLLELNVRSFLQARGKVNKGIRETLLKQPERFLAYNNGISATVEGLQTRQEEHGLVITHLKGLQIVNGGQTTASIYRAAAVDRAHLRDVYVAAKITVLSQDQHQEFVPNISRYANTQNVVQMADFSANDRLHVDLERISRQVWCPGQKQQWFYERARGQYEVELFRKSPRDQKLFKQHVPPDHRISKTDVARFLLTWQLRPHIVGWGAQKAFVEFMQLRTEAARARSVDEAWWKRLVAHALLHQATRGIVKEEGVEAYRANVVTYLIAHLSASLTRMEKRFDFDRVWDQQGISPALRTLLARRTHPMLEEIKRTAGSKNVTEWCKKAECWDALRELSLPMPTEPIPELVDGADAEQAESSAADLEQLTARIMSHDHETWFRWSAWGVESSFLSPQQTRLCRTLGGMASEGWRRKPEERQILRAGEILRIIEEREGG